MKHYNATTKTWLKINAQTEEEAQTIAKQIIDQALGEYVAARKLPNTVLHISKAKVIWVKRPSALSAVTRGANRLPVDRLVRCARRAGHSGCELQIGALPHRMRGGRNRDNDVHIG